MSLWGRLFAVERRTGLASAHRNIPISGWVLATQIKLF